MTCPRIGCTSWCSRGRSSVPSGITRRTRGCGRSSGTSNVTLRDNYYGYTLEVLIFESGVQDQYRINHGTDDARQTRQAIVDRLKWRIDGRFNMPAS